MELFVIVILVTVAGAQESQLKGPENTLSVVGSNVTLKCLSQSRNCIGIEWLKYAAGNPMTIFNPGGIISSDFRDRYRVDNKCRCDLIINNVKLTDAGRFLCRALISSNTVEKTADLIILETQPNCSTNASMDDTVEEDGVHLRCVVKYNGTNKVSMVWKALEDTPAAVKIGTKLKSTKIAPQNETGEGVRIPSTDKDTYNGTNRTSINASLNDTLEGDGGQLNCVVTYNETNTTSTVLKGVEVNGKILNGSYFVASAPKVPSFTCITSFAVETKDNYAAAIIGLATNTPYITCAIPAIKVLYSVRNVTLSPSRSYYTSGNVINCTAKGHPSPTFKWQEMENDGTWMDIQNQNGSEFTMTNSSSTRYRCVAMNVVRGNGYNATSNEFRVNSTRSDFSESFTATTIKSVAVGAAVGFLFLIILLIICFCERVCPGYKCCHSGNKPKDKIRKEQPLTENPDPCIYSVVNKRQDAHPKAKPSEPSKQGAPPKAIARTDKSKAGQTNAFQYEEVTYADLAMEVGPRKVVPKYNPGPQETLYAAVGAA